MVANDMLGLPDKFSEHVRSRWGWFLALGIIYILGGTFAILLPLLSTITFTLVIAVSLIVSGILQVVQALRMREWHGVAWHLGCGVICVAGGAMALLNPFAGAVAITIVIAATFLAQGITQVMQGLRVRPRDGWGWLMGAGVLAFLAGLVLMIALPASGFFTIGTLAGLAMIVSGWAYVWIATAARRRPIGERDRSGGPAAPAPDLRRPA